MPNISAKNLDCFVTRIWSFDLSPLQNDQEFWMKRVLQIRGESPEAAGRSNRSGWNSKGNLFLHKDFEALQSACYNCFVHAFKELCVDPSFRFGLSAWVNITGPGGYNVQHGHPRTFLSGCYYVKVPDKSGCISFSDPRAGAANAMLKAGGIMGSNNIKIQPSPGQLLIFPSWLQHSVELNESREERMSIAMNAVAASSRQGQDPTL
jgi:uncharacterized protein (TIGR02466 family)